MQNVPIVLLAKATLVGIFALLVGGLTLVGSSYFTANPIVLMGAAVVALCITALAGQWWLMGKREHAWLRWPQVSAMLLLVAIFAALFLRPVSGEQLPALPGVQYWELPTGSRIAYLTLAPETPAHAEPVVFVHGGPGVADMEGDAAIYGQLREEGYTVYIYDQVGAGRSSRLQDPTAYSVERDAADLEEIRKQIGAEQMILIAHSYGAGVAARYIAEHGDHVARLIVSSPGALVGGLADTGGPQSRLTMAQSIALYTHLLQPRSLAVYTMLQINPRAAHNFAGDAEMDARMENIYALTEPGLHCSNGWTGRRLRGLGFYANQFPQSTGATPPRDFTSSLARYMIPTLVIKGSCDYLSWKSALAYINAFKEGPAHLVYLRGAGHNVYQDQPQAFKQNIVAFLKDLPLPNEYTGEDVPADYETGF